MAKKFRGTFTVIVTALDNDGLIIPVTLSIDRPVGLDVKVPPVVKIVGEKTLVFSIQKRSEE